MHHGVRDRSYGAELIQQLENEKSPYRLSDSILRKALGFLETEQFIEGYEKT